MRTGVEIRGVELKCYDFRQCCTPIGAPLSRKHAGARRAASLGRHGRAARSRRAIVAATVELFSASSALRQRVATAVWSRAVAAAVKRVGSLPPPLATAMKAVREVRRRPAVSRGCATPEAIAAGAAVWELSEAVGLAQTTYAAISAYPRLFAATITSKPAAELAALARRVGAPSAVAAIVAMADAHRIPDTHYAQFGVPCRAMSKMWREIKAAAARRSTAHVFSNKPA
jgi:hypothetical protein